MNNYELTERGKIVIAVVLVVLLLVIPSVIILGVSSCSGSSPPEDNPSTSHVVPPPGDEDLPEISNTPLSTPDSGVSPSETVTAEPSPTPTPSPTETPDTTSGASSTTTRTPSPDENGEGDITGNVTAPEYGPVGLDITAGTMSFIFSPDDQTALDADTIEMLGEFLSSPKNTRGTQVRVEMPHISDSDETALVSAVARAFSQYNIDENGLVYVKSDEDVSERYFEIALSFSTIPNQK